MKDKVEDSCKDCTHLDTLFGDCCHPKSGGCTSLKWALEECAGKGRKHKRLRKKSDITFEK